MNGYQITLMTPIYHNDKFMWNLPRYVTVRAETQSEAEEQVKSMLKKAKTTRVDESLVIRTDDEYIAIAYTVYLGVAKRKCRWGYIK